MRERFNSEIIRRSIITLLIGLLTGSIVTSTYHLSANLENSFSFILKCVVYYLIMITTYRDLFILYSKDHYYTTTVLPVMLKKEPTLFNITYLLLFFNLIGYMWWSVFLVGTVNFKIGNFEISYWHVFWGVCFLDGINTGILRWKANKIFTCINGKLNEFQEQLKKWLIYDAIFITISTIAIFLNHRGRFICMVAIGLLIFSYFLKKIDVF